MQHILIMFALSQFLPTSVPTQLCFLSLSLKQPNNKNKVNNPKTQETHKSPNPHKFHANCYKPLGVCICSVQRRFPGSHPTHLALTFFLSPFLWWFPGFKEEGCDIYIFCSPWSTDLGSVSICFPVMAPICCKKKLLWWGVRAIHPWFHF